MTPEQRKRVAEVVTGQEGHLADIPEFNKYRLVFLEHSGWFSPSFSGRDHEKLSAITVALWLAAKLKEIEDDLGSWDKANQYIKAMADQDIESLLSLVLELSDG